MRSRFPFVLPALLVLSLAAAGADKPASKPATKGDVGKIVKLAADEITITNVNIRRDAARVYALTADTVYEVHHGTVRDHRHVPAKLADMKVGDVVTVTFDEKSKAAVMVSKHSDE